MYFTGGFQQTWLCEYLKVIADVCGHGNKMLEIVLVIKDKSLLPCCPSDVQMQVISTVRSDAAISVYMALVDRRHLVSS
ncbi:predicted protein [Plenodomus lingam JN3]|uniref:Predicted protein n=1 Tax=Leptosphaeria maculans (strain JN3 / isolate v23.1.3 / race Av1-4-5-6-7-8) TaxID=985895 RepID=E5AD72_LEPMJ|nr:predicted protein [Plenodomus lingam JN3]CBY02424.1 predicted protein [Plenodomus lingam JN3]